MTMKKPAKPLTELEIHRMCEQFKETGQEPTVLTLLEKFGRGGKSTLTKYLRSWKALQSETEQTNQIVIENSIPEEVMNASEKFAKICWKASESIALKLIESEQERIKQADLKREEEKKEDDAFSAKQTEMQNTLLENVDELTTVKEALTKDLAVLGNQLKTIDQSNKDLESKHNTALQEIEALKIKLNKAEKNEALLLQQSSQNQEKYEANAEDMKTKYQTDISKLDAQYDKKQQKTKKYHALDIKDLNTSHQTFITGLKSAQDKNINDIKNTHREAITQLQNNHEKMNQNYEFTINALKTIQKPTK